MLRSLRSTLIVASVLWTGGLLALMHMLSLMVIHAVPSARDMGHGKAVVLGVALMVAGVWTLRGGMAPFRRLRAGLLAVRRGEERRIDGRFPAELQPLIDELNALLEERDTAVKRAVAMAGDLAHGLKTPLALLAHEADEAEAAGNVELSESLGRHVERMSRHVDYHLARARAAASGAAAAAPVRVADCVETLIRTMSKLYASRELTLTSSVPPDLRVRVELQDMEEVVGNLLDNACRWARSRVRVRVPDSSDRVVLEIEDDGSGLAPELRAVVLERGVRVDEAVPGYGLGLAIARELVELYGGSITLDSSEMGGLLARVDWPAA